MDSTTTNSHSHLQSRQNQNPYDSPLTSLQEDTWRKTPDDDLDHTLQTLVASSRFDSIDQNASDTLLDVINAIGAEINKYSGRQFRPNEKSQLEKVGTQLYNYIHKCRNPKIIRALIRVISAADRCRLRKTHSSTIQFWAGAKDKAKLIQICCNDPGESSSHPDTDSIALLRTCGHISLGINPSTVDFVSPDDFNALHRLRKLLMSFRHQEPLEELEEAISNISKIIGNHIEAFRSSEFDDTIERLSHPAILKTIPEVMRGETIQKLLKTVEMHQFYLTHAHILQLKQLATEVDRYRLKMDPMDLRVTFWLSSIAKQIRKITETIMDHAAVHIGTEAAQITADYFDDQGINPVTLEQIQNYLPPALEGVIMEYHNPEIDIVNALFQDRVCQTHFNQLETSPSLCDRFVDLLLQPDTLSAPFLMARFVDSAPVRVQNCVFEAINRRGFDVKNSAKQFDSVGKQYSKLLEMVPENVTRLGLGGKVSRLFSQMLIKRLVHFQDSEEMYIPTITGGLTTMKFTTVNFPQSLRVLSVPLMSCVQSYAISGDLEEITFRGTLENNESIRRAVIRIISGNPKLRILKVEYSISNAKPTSSKPKPWTKQTLRKMIAEETGRSNMDDLKIVVEFTAG